MNERRLVTDDDFEESVQHDLAIMREHFAEIGGPNEDDDIAVRVRMSARKRRGRRHKVDRRPPSPREKAVHRDREASSGRAKNAKRPGVVK